MSDRTTKTFKTAGGHEVVMLDYITGREARDINDFLIKSKEADGALSSNKVNDHAMCTVIISLDGNQENIVSRILDLPFEDFSEISDAIVELITPKKKSLNSSSPTPQV